MSTEMGIIRNRFKTLITDAGDGLPTQFDNFDAKIQTDQLQCRLYVIEDDTKRLTFGAPGNNRHRTVGTMLARLTIKSNTGTKELEDMAETIRTNFEHELVSGIRFGVTKTTLLGKTRDGSKWQVDVSCPFRYDNFR